MIDKAAQVELYGRKLRDDLRPGTAYHLYRPGPHAGAWNVSALAATDEVILCESLIDAMKFWCAGYRHVTASYGTGGFTADHLEAFIRHGILRVLIAYDADDAGACRAACSRPRRPKPFWPGLIPTRAWACAIAPSSKCSTAPGRGEVIRLAVDGLDHDRGTVLVRQGKHAKAQIVPIGARALGWVERCLDELRLELRRLPDDGTEFLTQAGEPLSGNRLSELVSGYLAAAGHTGSCHLFRHTMATLMLEGGADVRYIQAMLGHADLATTEVYTRVGVTKLESVHTDSHPARLAGTRSGNASVAAEIELSAALDAEDDTGGIPSP